MPLASFVDFTVDYKSDIEEKTYAGSFRAKTRLTAGDTLRQNENRRILLGQFPSGAGQEEQSIAWAISYLQARLVAPYPTWWKPEQALELDVGVLSEVNNKCIDAINVEYEKLKKVAKEAAKDLSNLEDVKAAQK